MEEKRAAGKKGGGIAQKAGLELEAKAGKKVGQEITSCRLEARRV